MLAPHVRADSKIASRAITPGRAARENSAESAAITAGASRRSLLLRVKLSKRLSFVKSRYKSLIGPSHDRRENETNGRARESAAYIGRPRGFRLPSISAYKSIIESVTLRRT